MLLPSLRVQYLLSSGLPAVQVHTPTPLQLQAAIALTVSPRIDMVGVVRPRRMTVVGEVVWIGVGVVKVVFSGRDKDKVRERRIVPPTGKILRKRMTISKRNHNHHNKITICPSRNAKSHTVNDDGRSRYSFLLGHWDSHDDRFVYPCRWWC